MSNVKCTILLTMLNFPEVYRTLVMYEPAKYRTKLTIVFTVAWQLKHQPAEKCEGQLNSLHGIFSLPHNFDKTIKLFPNILVFEFCWPLRIIFNW